MYRIFNCSHLIFILTTKAPILKLLRRLFQILEVALKETDPPINRKESIESFEGLPNKVLLQKVLASIVGQRNAPHSSFQRFQYVSFGQYAGERKGIENVQIEQEKRIGIS